MFGDYPDTLALTAIERWFDTCHDALYFSSTSRVSLVTQCLRRLS